MKRGPPPEVNIRRAVAEDREGMARVHVESWKSTYRGIVPQRRLDAMTVEADLQGGFGRWLEDRRGAWEGWEDFVATTSAGEVVGFASGGPSRTRDLPYTGELGAIYLLREWQRRGLGRRLVSEVARHLLERGHRSLMVWVLEANPHRVFYEGLGGIVVRREVRPVAGTRLPELAYGWPDLTPLVEARPPKRL